MTIISSFQEDTTINIHHMVSSSDNKTYKISISRSQWFKWYQGPEQTMLRTLLAKAQPIPRMPLPFNPWAFINNNSIITYSLPRQDTSKIDKWSRIVLENPQLTTLPRHRRSLTSTFLQIRSDFCLCSLSRGSWKKHWVVSIIPRRTELPPINNVTIQQITGWLPQI